LEYDELIQMLIVQGDLNNPAIIEAFKTVKRADFMVEGTKERAAINSPVPIMWGQTISQPATVAFMLELLEPALNERILDIGSGSGWTTALLSKIVGEKGKVTAIEFFPALKEFGEKNTKKYPFAAGVAEFICGDGFKGCQENAPYDKILVSAEACELPIELKKQLKIGGKIVIPIGPSICLFVKKSETELEVKE
jgi:protein-L-isoaspartate(D-aspartate) O-methyltransferase